MTPEEDDTRYYISNSYSTNTDYISCTPSSGGAYCTTGGLIGGIIHGDIISSYANVSEIDVNGDEVGGLIGYGSGLTVYKSFSFVEEEVSGSQSVGGLIGLIWNSSIRNSSAVFYGEIKNDGGYTGGLIGELKNSYVLNSYFYSTSGINTLTTVDYIGGFVGYGLNSSILNSYVYMASIYEYDGAALTDNVGGFIGYGEDVSLSNVFSDLIEVKSQGSNKGRLIGSGSGMQISNSYTYLETICEGCNNDEGEDYQIDVDTYELEDGAIYFSSPSNPPMDEWDFTYDWEEDFYGGVPYLK